MFGIFEEIADAVSAVWHKCKNCGVWHRGGVFCDRCLQRGRTEWTIKTNRVRKAKWWR